MTRRVHDTLHTLGITHTYRGYRHVEKAILLALEDEDRLESVVKEIYMVVAKECGCN